MTDIETARSRLVTALRAYKEKHKAFWVDSTVKDEWQHVKEALDHIDSLEAAPSTVERLTRAFNAYFNDDMRCSAPGKNKSDKHEAFCAGWYASQSNEATIDHAARVETLEVLNKWVAADCNLVVELRRSLSALREEGKGKM